MKTIISVFARVFMALATYTIAALAVVMVAGIGLLTEFKTYIGIFERTLSAIILMMFSTSASGAVYVGNKLFGSMALTSVEPDPHRQW